MWLVKGGQRGQLKRLPVTRDTLETLFANIDPPSQSTILNVLKGF